MSKSDGYTDGYYLEQAAKALSVPVSDLRVEERQFPSSTPEPLTGEALNALRAALRLAETKSPAAREVESAFTRLRLLCEESNQLYGLFTALKGHCFYYIAQGNLQLATMFGEKLCQVAEEQLKHPTFIMEAKATLGTTLAFAGQFIQAQAPLQEAYHLYAPERQRFPDTLTDTKVACLIYMAHVRYSLGYPEQARAYIMEARDWSEDLPHGGYSRALTMHYGAALFQLLREFDTTAAWGARERQLSEEEWPLWRAGGMIQEGWALVMQDRIADGIRRMEEGIQAWQSLPARTGLARWHTLLAEAYGKAERPQEGLAELKKAIMLVQQTGDRHYEVEVYRMQGVLSLQLPQPDMQSAEASFQQALDVARRQQAKSFELRTAIGLSRLWEQQGKRGDAYAFLEPIYGWFQGSIDTADLQEARGLLETLVR